MLETVSGSDLIVYAVFSDYEPTGKIGRVDHENGTNTIYQYDPESARLTKITTHDPSGQVANDIQRKSYEYSGAGNIETIVDEEDSNKSYTYEYDGLHRLTKEKINGGTNATYTYNAVGNIMSKVVGSTNLTYTYHSTKKHAVSNINKNGTNYAFGYDNCGNMTSGYDFTDPSQVGTRSLYYNAENMPYRIVHVKGGTTKDTRFYYDGEGRRVKKYIVGVGITYYIGGHIEKINGSLVKYIFAGDMRIARINGSEKRIFHKDHLGSSTAITDMNGNEVEISNYMPFGSLRSHSGSYVSDYKFTDQELDDSTGLYNYGARLYDPVIGRFITADSIVQNFSDPQTLNRYSYCRNNPLIYTDPSGHLFGIDDAILIAAVVKGAIAGAVAGGTFAAITGGDIGQGILTGAISGAIFGGIGAIPGMGPGGFEPIVQAGIHAAGGIAAGGINTSITGR